MAVLAWSENTHDAVAEAVPVPLPSNQRCRQMLAGTVVIHAVEAIAAGRMARHRGLNPEGWRGQTFVVGFPSLLALRRVER